ncbi:hypothetical protein [Steroidobacter agaridevorans]|uniref:hypothetical protein n=1 Tax=Steroidobacter agaridevorans TaxID=2695856 RepID=UPI001328CF75|nr:hypothetical protein [Steroidobacter agaridevorans]GFE87718.1 hypothetical protein GCM10011488_26720 [Steroidobacter agaridevorans]
MNREQAQHALQRFVADDEFSVLALSGNWGIGKTHLWMEFTKGKLPAKFNGVSYVSLFGLASIDALRLKATGNIVLRKDRSEILRRYKDQAKTSLIPYDLVSSGMNKIAQVLGSGWMGLATEAAYWFLRDSLVCLDDIERADDDLTPAMIMGFVDELKSKGCKIVLVLNREKARQDELTRYWEKVVDIDVKLKPTIADNVSIAFAPSTIEAAYGHWARPVFEAVEADNIRVHKRAAWLTRQLDKLLTDYPTELRRYVTEHAAVLTWALIDPSAAIPPAMILSSQYGSLYLTMIKEAGKERELTDVERRWVSATERLDFSPASFDPVLIDLITTGWCDTDALAALLRDLATEFRVNSARRRLRETYRLYQESFALNRNAYVATLRGVLADELNHLSLFEFDGGIDSLKRNGGDFEDLVTRYISDRGSHLQAVAEASEQNTQPINARLAAEILRREQQYESTRHSIDSVAEHLISSDGWSPTHIRFLQNQTSDKFKNWLLSNPSNLREKITAILDFRKMDNEFHRNAASPLEQALRGLADEDEFHRERIEKVYEIQLNPASSKM